MNKQTIIKYIAGQTSPQENEVIERWIMSDELHVKYYTQLKDLYVFSNFPNEIASDSQMSVADKIIQGSDNSCRLHDSRQGSKVKLNDNEPIQQLIDKQAHDSFIAENKIKDKEERSAEITKKRNRLFRIMYYAGAAVILVALVTNIFLLSIQKIDKRPELLSQMRLMIGDIPSNYLHTIYTNKGVKGEVKLPDGSIVKLNSDSKIVFPDKFVGETREVYLTGEAFFNVVSNPDTPMIVSTNKNLYVKVLGTKFNIRSYDNEPNASTTLYSGKIDILQRNKNGETVKVSQISPTESFSIKNNVVRPVISKQVDTVKVSAWTRGNLIFEVAPMDQVLRDLERWYGASFIINDNSVLGQFFSASFNNESLVQVMEILRFCTGIKYKIRDNNVVELSAR